MRRYLLLPTLKQFKAWTLPNKASLVGLWFGAIGLAISIYSMFVSDENVIKRFNSINDMRENLEGFNSEYLDFASEFVNLVEAERKSDDGSPGEWPYTYEITLLGQNDYGIDSNEDGAPELVVDVGLNCMGNGGCASPIYAFNLEKGKLLRIGEINTRNYGISEIKVNGWLMLHDTWKSGLCDRIKTTYSYGENGYIPESEETINLC